jgi:fluoride exporter
MFWQFTAVGVGAALGAWLRWGFNVWLAPRSGAWALGTIAANLVGGYLVGVAVAYFALRPDLPPEGRLFVITGFLGGLTTFSAFSAEVTGLLARGDLLAGTGLAAVHLFGSLLLTAAGFATVRVMTA